VPELLPIWDVAVFLLGACVGSFLNVCIWRMPRDESIFFPRSHCPKCGHVLSWYENIPLLSWVCLRGKCRKCRAEISFRYFVVELLTAIMFFIVWRKVTVTGEPLAEAPLYFFVTMYVLSTFFIDMEHRIIPNETTYTAMVIGLVYAFAFPEVWGNINRTWALLLSLVSMLVAGGSFALLAYIGKKVFRKDALGWGDVKFLAGIGACLGLKACFFTVFFGSLTGSVAGLVAMLMARKRSGVVIPFGPFMACGVYLWILFEPQIIMLYLYIMQRLHG